MHVLIDADALPKAAKEVLFRVAGRMQNLRWTMVANKRLHRPPHLNIAMLTVEKNPDEADDRIVEDVRAGDLVITSDVPLADRVIEKGAFVLGPKGDFFSSANIKNRLATRNLLDQLRSEGLVQGGPAPYSEKDAQSFANQLNNFLVKRLREESSDRIADGKDAMNLEAAQRYATERLRHDLPANIFYHDLSHTLRVFEAARRIGLSEGLSEKELGLLETAALYHDLGFIQRYPDNEPLSCGMARETLPGFSYRAEDIEKICGMIMATKIPQAPATLAEMVLCDADLDYLGTESFESGTAALRKELEAQGRCFSEREWTLFVLNFLEAHRYFTTTARASREAVLRGHIETWRARLLAMPAEEDKTKRQASRAWCYMWLDGTKKP